MAVGARPTEAPTSVTQFAGDSLRGVIAVTHLLGRPEMMDDGPQSFVVEARGAGAFNRTHFHVVDQYQVFVAGSGRVGRSRFKPRPLFLHYADAYTPYGPIASGPDGYVYVTLRPAADPGARYVPEARAERARVDGRHRGSHVTDEESALVEVIPPEDDGLGAWIVRSATAHESLPMPLSQSVGGAHLLVTRGEIAIGEARYPRLGNVFVAAGESWPVLTATADATEVAVLCFPSPRQ